MIKNKGASREQRRMKLRKLQYTAAVNQKYRTGLATQKFRRLQDLRAKDRARRNEINKREMERIARMASKPVIKPAIKKAA